jgi:allophanate hydrolase subunit 1
MKEIRSPSDWQLLGQVDNAQEWWNCKVGHTSVLKQKPVTCHMQHRVSAISHLQASQR